MGSGPAPPERAVAYNDGLVLPKGRVKHWIAGSHRSILKDVSAYHTSCGFHVLGTRTHQPAELPTCKECLRRLHKDLHKARRRVRGLESIIESL